METIKISELTEATSLTGLYVLGTDANNESVKVPLETLLLAGIKTNKITLVNGDYTATIELDENGYVHVDSALYSDVALSVGGSDS